MSKLPERPYEFQTLLETAWLNGENIILQAPAGAGKTRAVWRPALKGLESDIQHYPQKLIHAVPMRVLAKSFYTEFSKIAKENRKWQQYKWQPTIQTGEQADDPFFDGRMIIATVDQVLASFLNIPYGISKRLDNLNAGALIGSYLIFDEFHLYPSKQMLLTVLAMLKMLKGVSRFALMSASFSPHLLQAIANLLEATPIYENPKTPLEQGLFKDIGDLNRQYRRWIAHEETLSAPAILQSLKDHRKVLCIVNQVERAQGVYQELLELIDHETTDIYVLHARFYPDDRKRNEDAVLTCLGKKTDTSPPDDGRRKIVIATQVVEVGLDISADILLTECAPAASLIQRAGRCVRWGGEGEVHVFQVPLREDTQVPDYAPYFQDGFEEVCQKTWEALTSSTFNGQILQYDKEQALIEIAHTEHDKAMLIDGLEHRIDTRIDEITRCMRERHEGFVHLLIRPQETSQVRLYIMGNHQDERLSKNLYDLEAFSVSKGKVARVMAQLETAEVDAPFCFAGGQEQESQDEQDAQLRTKTVYTWHPIKDSKEIFSQRLIVAHPSIVGYRPELGLHWTNLSGFAPESPEREKKQQAKHSDYKADTYVQHIQGLMSAYRRIDDNLGYRRLDRDYQYAFLSLLRAMGHSDTWETVDRYLRLTIALHDVGKLNRPWQAWAQAWQAHYSHYRHPKVSLDEIALAHTDTDFITGDEKKAAEAEFRKHYKGTRGNHAVESAEAASNLIWEATKGDEDERWFNVISAAICHHHTPSAEDCGEFHMIEHGESVLYDSLKACGFTAVEAEAWTLVIQRDFKRRGRKVKVALQDSSPSKSEFHTSLLYYLVVRILRLADQRSSHFFHVLKLISE